MLPFLLSVSTIKQITKTLQNNLIMKVCYQSKEVIVMTNKSEKKKLWPQSSTRNWNFFDECFEECFFLKNHKLSFLLWPRMGWTFWKQLFVVAFFVKQLAETLVHNLAAIKLFWSIIYKCTEWNGLLHTNKMWPDALNFEWKYFFCSDISSCTCFYFFLSPDDLHWFILKSC